MLERILSKAINLGQVRQYDKYIAMCCPFHNDHTPSLLAYRDGWFRCLACGVEGRLGTLLRKLDNNGVVVSRPTYIDSHMPDLSSDLIELEEQAYDAHLHLQKFEHLHWYLELRGIEEVIDQCNIGYINGWYTIPVYNQNRKFIGMGLRAGPHVQEVTGKRFCQPRGQKGMMYCPNWSLMNKPDYLFIVFGFFDALVLNVLGLPCVTPTGGKDSFDPAWLDGIRKRCIILPDFGEDDTARILADQLGWRGEVHMLRYNETIEDPADYAKHDKLEDLEKQLWSKI